VPRTYSQIPIKHPHFSPSVCSAWDKGYRYGFNGKEKDIEVFNGCIAFEARIYDSRIGRFFSADPRESEYAWQSTYVYFKNSPIGTLDYLGKGDVDPIDPVDNNITKPESINNKNDDGKYDKDVTGWRNLRWKIKAFVKSSTPNSEIEIRVRNRVDGKKLDNKTPWRPSKYKNGKNNGGNTPTAPTTGDPPSIVPPIGGLPPPPGIGVPGMIRPLVNLTENNLPGAIPFFLTAISVPITSNFTIPVGAAGAGQLGTLNISYGSDLAVPTNPTGTDNIPDQFVITNTTTGVNVMNTGQVLIPMVNATIPAVTGGQFAVTVTPGNIGGTGDRFFIVIWFTIP
jgi:RHS repeat-associated protein